jgi:hypothetical protein
MSYDGGGGGNDASRVGLRTELHMTAQLLGHSSDELERVLCTRTMGAAARKSIYTISLSPKEVRGGGGI